MVLRPVVGDEKKHAHMICIDNNRLDRNECFIDSKKKLFFSAKSGSYMVLNDPHIFLGCYLQFADLGNKMTSNFIACIDHPSDITLSING